MSASVNWLLMMVTRRRSTVGFGKSDNLAAAYGIAVSADDADDVGAAVHRDARDLALEPAGGRGGGGLSSASSTPPSLPPISLKIAEGGYVPLLLAAAVYGVMWIWHSGAARRMRRACRTT